METTLAPTLSAEKLRQSWNGLLQAKPGLRIRDAADQLDVSEAQLLATTIGPDCTRLQGPFPQMLKRFKELGRVMSLTRNDACILEHKGAFEKVSTIENANHSMGLALGPIETRVFLKHWYVAFAVRLHKPDKILDSIQVFDYQGDAVTKIFLQAESDRQAYQRLVEDFRDPNQSPEQEVLLPEVQHYNPEPDQEAFLAEWAQLQDTHDFVSLLKNHNLPRYRAIELAEGRFTRRIEPAAAKTILEEASAQKMPLMIFAGNRGNLQIHQDVVRSIRPLERGQQYWLNVLDPDFNLHLRADLINSAWAVEKPTKDGPVHSVELYDAQNQLICQFFGLRKPGIPQREDWLQLVQNL